MASNSRFGIIIDATNRAKAALVEAERGIKALEQSAVKASQTTKSLGQSGDALSRALSAVGRDVQGSAASLGTFGNALGAVGGPMGAIALAAVGIGVGMVGMARHAGEAQEQLLNLSERTDLSVAALGALEIASSEAGISFQSIQPGLDIFNRKIAEARAGIGDADDAFRKLGVSLRDSTTGAIRPTEQVLTETAQKLRDIQDPAERTRLAMETFGRSGSRFINVLSADLEENKKRAIELGLVYEGPIADAVRKTDVGFDRMSTALQGLGKSLGAIAAISLLPLIEQAAKLAEEFAKAAKSAADFFMEVSKKEQENQALTGAGLVMTPSGPMSRRDAEAQARGDTISQQRLPGLIVPGTTWPPPGPPMPTAEQMREAERQMQGPTPIEWWRAGVNAIGPPSQQFFSEQVNPFARGFEVGRPMTEEPLKIDTHLDESEKALQSLMDALGDDFPAVLDQATDETGNTNEALLGFIGTLKQGGDSALEFGIKMAHTFTGTIRGGVQNFVQDVISGTDRIDKAFGKMVESMVQKLIAETATNIILSVLHVPGHQAGGTIMTGIRGMDTNVSLLGRGETVLTHDLTDKLDRFFTFQRPAMATGQSVESQPRVSEYNFHFHGQFMDKNALRQFADEHFTPILKRSLDDQTFRPI